MRSLYGPAGFGLTAVLVVSGCGVSPETFADAFPTAYCERQIDCSGGARWGASETVDSTEACVTSWADHLAAVEADERCAYDARAAKQCLAALEDSDCTENTAIYYECRSAWSESRSADDGDDEDECRISTSGSDDGSDGSDGSDGPP